MSRYRKLRGLMIRSPTTTKKDLQKMSIRTSLSLRMSFLLLAATAILAACGSPTASSSSSSASNATTTQPSGSGAAGSNARSGPASGGAAGIVGSVSTSSFTMSTSAGVSVTVDEAPSTTYQKGTSPASASAITTGEPVLVLGTTSGVTITAAQVIVQPIAGGGAATSSASGVVPFQRGAPTTSKHVC